MRVLVLAMLIPALAQAWYYGRPEPNAWTTGGVWPLPWTINYFTGNHSVNPSRFRFQAKQAGCDIIDKAIARYQKLSFPGYNASTYAGDAGTLTSVQIDVTSGCPTGVPSLSMDETYTVSITTPNGIGIIQAKEVWGALRAMETFSHLVYLPKDNVYMVRTANITDGPRFPWRGVMIDSSRHFLPISTLLQNLDVMAQNKMNVFHWHLVDSEAFPYPSLKYPDLTSKGAYSPKHQYSVADVKKVIDYARLRGIRVVAEFDTPGHTGAWGYGIPNLTPKCYQSNGKAGMLPNILDPTVNSTFDFLSGFFAEALALFPDEYMHFGGDEVIDDMNECWYNNPEVRSRMQQLGFGSDTGKLLNYYWARLFDIIDKARAGTKKLVWQEVLDQNVPQQQSIAHVWKGATIQEAYEEMGKVTANGHFAILSSCWYMNYIKYGADWGYVNEDAMRARGMYYQCDPQGFHGTKEQKNLVLGGEAAIWGEFVDGTNLINRLWPRASAVAERLWSDPSQTQSADNAWPRLHEFKCRLIHRGFRMQPVMDPDYCPYEWQDGYQEI
ncbi:unnamed protein product, partial [Mesorhabditis spiculigera]